MFQISGEIGYSGRESKLPLQASRPASPPAQIKLLCNRNRGPSLVERNPVEKQKLVKDASSSQLNYL